MKLAGLVWEFLLPYIYPEDLVGISGWGDGVEIEGIYIYVFIQPRWNMRIEVLDENFVIFCLYPSHLIHQTHPIRS